MTAFLPPNLLALFAPREPLHYLPQTDQRPWEKKPWPYSGVAQFLTEFEDPNNAPPPTRGETRDERRSRKRREQEERYTIKLVEEMESWDPSNNSKISGDPFKTLFLGRINYDTSDGKIRREFESYGPVKHINIVMNSKTSKPQGYAFIEYENERDMHSAYKYGDGKKIDGKRVVVDVERGRTVKSWKPRRLGGGMGGTRRGPPNECIKYSGRVDERDMDKEKEKEKDRDRDRNSDDRDKKKERGRNDRERGDKERGDKERGDRERRRRSRSRDKERRRGKSRSRERERKDRSRSRDRDRKDKKKDRDKDRDRKGKDRDKRDEKDKESRKERSEHKNEHKKEPREDLSNHDNNHRVDDQPVVKMES